MDLNKIIVFDNQDFFAVNKPKGLVVNISQTTKLATLQDLVGDYNRQVIDLHIELLKALEDLNIEIVEVSIIPKLSTTFNDPKLIELTNKLSGVKTQLIKEFVDRNGIVHRLDKGTSGVILVARDALSFKKLKSNFTGRKIVKTYYAVTFGNILTTLKGNKSIHINLPLDRNPRRRTEFAIVDNGREAESLVYTSSPNEISVNSSTDVVKEFKGTSFSLVKVLPKTGRTHQIRVHLKALNHEILGDSTYMGKGQTKLSKDLNAPLMLHAKDLEFKLSGKKYKIEAEFPAEFSKIINKIWK